LLFSHLIIQRQGGGGVVMPPLRLATRGERKGGKKIDGQGGGLKYLFSTVEERKLTNCKGEHHLVYADM